MQDGFESGRDPSDYTHKISTKHMAENILKQLGDETDDESNSDE